MALTAAVRLPGPSWDEEVVPALRKRLESESRTLTKRMSAISLSEDVVATAYLPEPTARQRTAKPSHKRRQSSTSTARASPLQMESSHSGSTSTASTSRANPKQHQPASEASSSSASYQRSRTYSQPDSPHFSNGHATKRSAEPKPTRIPKPSKAYGTSSTGNTPTFPQTNGFSTYGQQHQQYYSSEQSHEGKFDSHFTSSTTRSTLAIPNNRSTSGLLNESAPFPPSSSVSSIGNGYSQNEYPYVEDEEPPRPSMDSEERPFEHWYRGEVSRNGGVGELRVGRRQEMLEIANYGHMIRKRKVSPGWNGQQQHLTEDLRHRKRAGSIGGLTDAERIRGSVLFDEEGMNAVGRVLDEDPLTDLEKESDMASLSSRYRPEPDFIRSTAQASYEAPITENNSSSQILSSSRNGQYPPTRIPSRPANTRRSSESRAPTPTSGLNGSTSSSKTPSPPPMPITTMRSVSGQSMSGTPAVNGKRVVSPTTPGKRRTPVKSLRGKQAPPSLAKKDPREVSHYSLPAEGEELEHAIPTWTQPIHKSGNWDEVVLPVVARQKGMDDHYQTADGSPQPRMVDKTVAPAPGTFGYDATKYRRNMNNEQESIPMDEFGRSSERPILDQHKPEWTLQPYLDTYTADESRGQARPSPPPSPAPFSHYAPPRDQVIVTKPNTAIQQRPPEAELLDQDDKHSGGCCKCTIM
ncbi:hypothetical protein FA15DRAFT_127814 [Coprinopsis marcescibilis]|uniref:Uncharacterized protein n=1 Tax=Coprinopsis marcescibilis TaxID=230819 RepID=A0A5C3KJE9_COPMA|nr:hypothetical protein FA15DRAFT_127814 [Coprinopsis marcescibilis]